MATSHSESLSYPSGTWKLQRETHSSSMVATSSGTKTRSSALIPINQITGTVSARFVGGYAWIAAHDDEGETPDDYCATISVTLTLYIYLVNSNGERYQLAKKAAAPSRGGFLNLYDRASAVTYSFDTSQITAEQKQLYRYVQFEFTISSSASSVSCKRKGSYENGGSANPNGSVTWYVRDTINVDFDGTEMTNLYFDGNEMGSLYYDGNAIF